MSDFVSDTITIGKLFDPSSFYRVPSYQRPFSWDTEQFDDLIVDIRDADKTANYFLGTIVLHKETDGTFAIVDGQQRITSLLILLACLRDSIDDDDIKREIQDTIQQRENKTKKIPERIRIHVKDADVFQKVVATLGGTTAGYDPNDFASHEYRYVVASKAFHTEIESLNQTQRVELVQFIFNKCVLIYLQAASFEDAFRLFEIVNDRGKQLRRIDILKSKNISPDAIVHEPTREKIASTWESLESELGEDIFEAVFFLLRLILVKDKPQADLLKEFEKRVFSAGLVKKGVEFTSILFEYVRLYRDVFVDQNYIDLTEKDGIRYQSLIYIMDAEFSASEWRACILQFAKKFGREKFYPFCLAIEKLYLTQWTGAVRKDERYSAYTSVLKDIDKLKDPDAVISNVPFDEAAIIKEITRSNVYTAGFCKYALLRLELVTSEHEVPKKLSARSIEHVFPQNPAAGSEWEKSLDGRKVEEFVHSIGNLVLISKSRNSAANNHDFDDKKKKYLKPRVSDYPRSIQVLGYTDWSPDIIDQRTAEVAKIFLEEI